MYIWVLSLVPGASSVVQSVKLYPATLVSHVGVQVRVSAVPFQIQLSANVPGRATEDSPSVMAPALAWPSAEHCSKRREQANGVSLSLCMSLCLPSKINH